MPTQLSTDGYSSGVMERRVSFDATKPTIPKVGQQWNVPERYQLKHHIGKGAYGAVCAAVDKETQRNVAIKKCKHLFDDLIDCKRILREIAILRRLDHGHVVKLFDVLVPQRLSTFDEISFVMEQCDSDMKKLVRTPVQLSALHVNTLLYNLLVGCEYLHCAGIYHRDLKPANCLINQNCSVKICDFGLARAVNDEAATSLPNTPREDEEGGDSQELAVVPVTLKQKRMLTGHVVTRWYRAPELILLQEEYDSAIDVWSVGCIYAELLNLIHSNRVEDRGPLFPGSSCFPLSPASGKDGNFSYHTRGQKDQLNVIFNVLGTPSDEDIALIGGDAAQYLQCFKKRRGDGLEQKFASASNDQKDILSRLLMFSAKSRCSVQFALAHAVFSGIRDPNKEVAALPAMPPPVVLDFEQADLDERTLRLCFLQEIRAHHPDGVPEDLEAALGGTRK